jgi:hypothetical protein
MNPLIALLFTACAPPVPTLADWLPPEAQSADLEPCPVALVASPETLHVITTAPPASATTLPLHDGRFDEDTLKGLFAPPLYDLMLPQARALMDDPAVDFRGELCLFVDRQIPSETLQLLLYTSGQAMFGDFQLVAFHDAPAAPAAPAAPPISDLTAWWPATTVRPSPGLGVRQGELRYKDEVLATFQVDDRGATFLISLAGEDFQVGADASLLSDPSDPILYASFAEAAQAARYPVLPSLEQLLHTSKRADDDFIGALERAQSPERTNWLQQLAQASDPPAARWLAVAGILGEFPIEDWGLPPEAVASARVEAEAFRSNPLQGMPLGIYSQDQELSAIFLRDRWLMQPLRSNDRAIAEGLRAVLESEPALASRLQAVRPQQAVVTNPSRGVAISEVVGDQWPAAVHLWPPATSHETELIDSLGGSAVVGTSGMDQLVSAVRSGAVSLSPRTNSGWYDHQQWALEPLLSLPESEVLSSSVGYRKRLEDAFRAAVAMRRETHVKSLALPGIGAMAPVGLPVDVAPDLRIEPLPTHYDRSAGSYDFLSDAVEVSGPQQQARERYADAAAIARADLGIGDTERDLTETLGWLEGWESDPLFSEDVRFMVPIGQGASGDPTVWAVLGVKTIDVTVAYDRAPSVVSLTEGVALEVHLREARYTLLAPVFAELSVAEVLDREALRALVVGPQRQRVLVAALVGE